MFTAVLAPLEQVLVAAGGNVFEEEVLDAAGVQKVFGGFRGIDAGLPEVGDGVEVIGLLNLL